MRNILLILLFVFCSCSPKERSRMQDSFTTKNNWATCCKGNTCNQCFLSNTESSNVTYENREVRNSEFKQFFDSKGVYKNCRFENLVMDSVVISKANFSSCSFRNSRFKKLVIKGSDIYDLVFDAVTFEDLQIVDSKLENLSIQKSNGTSLKIRATSNNPIRSLSINDSNLLKSEFIGSIFERARITDSDLEGSNFSGSTWVSSDILNTNLKGVSAEGADLQGLDLCGSKVDWESFPLNDSTYCSEKQGYCLVDGNKYVKNGETWEARVENGNRVLECVDGLVELKSIECDGSAERIGDECVAKSCKASNNAILASGQSQKTRIGWDFAVESCLDGVLTKSVPNECPNGWYIKVDGKCISPCTQNRIPYKPFTLPIEPSSVLDFKLLKSAEKGDYRYDCRSDEWVLECKESLSSSGEKTPTFFAGCGRALNDKPLWTLKPFRWETKVWSSEINQILPKSVSGEYCRCEFKKDISLDGFVN